VRTSGPSSIATPGRKIFPWSSKHWPSGSKTTRAISSIRPTRIGSSDYGARFPDLSPLEAAHVAAVFARVEEGWNPDERWHAAGLTRYLAFRRDDTRYRTSALRRFPEYYRLWPEL
jgi:hypothetical protein